MTDFICVDVETANESSASICQIGVATFIDGVHQPELDFETFVNPQSYFVPQFTALHGISEDQVVGAPTFPQVYSTLLRVLQGKAVLAHTQFDRVSLKQAAAKYNLPEITSRWLDTLRVARRAWPERMYKQGHRLVDLASLCDIPFRHHSALQDAWCAGRVFLQACTKTQLDLESWYVRVKKPVLNRSELTPNPEGYLCGERLVFTGTLSMMTRREASELASAAGAEVARGVTKHTTLVVVGEQDEMKLAGKDISRSNQNALDWIAKGKKIKIITGADFSIMVLPS